MTELTPPPDAGRIQDEPLTEALSTRYLAYALSTITQRALPDVRDGLKPVHRRLLFAMRELKLDPKSGFKKCARVVGDVIGKYHPHGDQAVYDAMVRLAQTFAARYPLVEGQGNFGNLDGDNAAAMRYTEARLTQAAKLLLEGLDADTVDFRETYSGEDEEPVVLPAGFPNLLANGAAGIAVGMATSIPPHNAGELCNAALHLIKHPNARTDTLIEHVKGPDFPTGGILVDDPAGIAEAYATGRGSFRLRAKWETEDLGRGQYQIVITEIPYQIQKSKLVERIAELVDSKKLPLLGGVSDESAEDVRMILEPRSRTVEAEILMESVFKLTDLESRVSLNMNVLDPHGAPRVMGLRDVLQYWLDHRREVLQRATRHRLAAIADRLEVLEGYLIVYLNLDEVIRIIREEDEPKKELIATFKLSDRQAEAILNMRLRSLRKLEEFELKKEHDALSGEQGELEALMASEDAQWDRITEQIREARDAFKDDPRRTTFGAAPEGAAEMVSEALVVREPITVVLSEKGWIRALKGKVDDVSDLKFKEGDRAKFVVQAETTDKIMLFASNGRFYTLAGDKLPGGRGAGEPLRLMLDLEEDHEPIALFRHDPERKLLLASSAGYGFVTSEKDLVAQTKSGKQVMTVSGDVEAAAAREVTGDRVAVIGDNRKLLIYPLEEVSELSRGKGVKLQTFRDGGLADVAVFNAEDGFTVIDTSGRRREIAEWKEYEGKRAQAGRLAPKGFPRTGKFGPDFRL